MFIVNKIVGTVMSPLGLPILLLLCAAAWSVARKNARVCLWTSLACSVWLWIWGCGVTTRIVGVPLEREWFSQMRVEDIPQADVIVLLGGGMCANKDVYPYPDMHSTADRVWHAARLYKAGKAPLIMPSGQFDKDSTEPLLRDLGVPQSAIAGEYASRNTEENARCVGELIDRMRKESGSTNAPPPRALLVTSAWHMRRSLLMYRKYAKNLEIIPAPADFESTLHFSRGIGINEFFPSAENFVFNSYMAKELVGYWGYRLLR